MIFKEKEQYVTITGMNHYYGLVPFKVGKKIKCTKEPKNPYDTDAIKATMKHIGTVGYIANTPYTAATGTKSASRIYEKVKKKFVVEVMFITGHSVICKVVDGIKEENNQDSDQKDIFSEEILNDIEPDDISPYEEEPSDELPFN